MLAESVSTRRRGSSSREGRTTPMAHSRAAVGSPLARSNRWPNHAPMSFRTCCTFAPPDDNHVTSASPTSPSLTEREATR